MDKPTFTLPIDRRLEICLQQIDLLVKAIELSALQTAGLNFLLLREQTTLIQLRREKENGGKPPTA